MREQMNIFQLKKRQLTKHLSFNFYNINLSGSS